MTTGYEWQFMTIGEEVPIVIDTDDPEKNYLPEDRSALFIVLFSWGFGAYLVYDVRRKIKIYKQQ